ncbi:hypothetical protein [Streptomyces sp. SP17KL33]|uniref:hypothetical protein n=1 Tax=Streptomyces sp. SP17KL33 TaxID=3002534 RepID=UPI002E7636A4|nr:hypothetical protein [Streptomyces sp. SP17KL33]MEE1838137.1 hypothetical protein [Streptomyces sp. SP17KL33]
MSATEKVNEELPDGEALAGFAAGALGGGARRRRRQQTNNAATPAETPAAEEAGPSPVTPAAVPEPLTTEEPAAPSTPPPATAQEPARNAAAAEPSPSAPERERLVAVATRPAQSESASAAPEPASEPGAQREATVPPQPTAPDAAAEAASEPEAATAQPVPSTTTAVEVRAVPVAVARTSPVPPALQGGVVQVTVPDLGPSGARATQCTVMISQNVRDRFARYQLEKKMAGEKEPSNALVVRRAFLSARRNDLFLEILTEMYHRANAVDEEDYDEDGLLGEVVGRRAIRGRLRDSGQQSFRPSAQELATYDAFCTAYGFADRSAFMEGLLDRFLPQLPASGRRR